MNPAGMNPLTGYRTLALAHSTAYPGQLPPTDGTVMRVPAMTLQAVADALSHSSNQDVLAPAGGIGGSLMSSAGALGASIVQHALKPSAAGIAKRSGQKPSATGRRQQRNVLCPHNRRKQNCLECGTAILCPHNKRKAFCR
jgi:hypothetical protein